jgi:hypothetical protein
MEARGERPGTGRRVDSVAIGHFGGARRPPVRLLARRQGQLRRGPGVGGRDRRGLPDHPARGAGKPELPAAGDTIAALEAANARGNPKSRPRSRAEFARFFDGLDIVPPGIVSVAEWRADAEPQPRPSFADISGYGAVGRVE